MTLLIWLLLRSDPYLCSQIFWWTTGCPHYVAWLSDCEQHVMAACGWNPYY